MKHIKNFNESQTDNVWSDEEINELNSLGFTQKEFIFTSPFIENHIRMVTRRRLQDIVWEISKENDRYRIKSKFPHSRSHLNNGERKSIRGIFFNNIGEIPNIIDKLSIEMANSPDIYCGNG